jgi:hypothetical protein
MRWTVIGLGLTVFAGVAVGQAGEEKLTFEVASVKACAPRVRGNKTNQRNSFLLLPKWSKP